MSPEKIGMVVIGYCDNMTSPSASFKRIAYYQKHEGKIVWDSLEIAEEDMNDFAKEILDTAANTCTTLEEVKEMFSSPHSSLQIMEILGGI